MIRPPETLTDFQLIYELLKAQGKEQEKYIEETLKRMRGEKNE
jgi:hypothetical protein